MKKSVLLLFMLIAFSAFREGNDAGVVVGDKVKDFSLRGTKGTNVSLSGYDNIKGAIVIFTCNHCPFSQAYEDRIIALHNKFAAKGFPVVAINSNDAEQVPEDNFEEMVLRANDKHYPFDYLYDEDQNIAHKFGAARTPHVFILQKTDGQYFVRYIGAIDDNTDNPKAVTKKYVEDAVNNLIAGKPVANAMTKAIGCTIKWKQ